MNDVNFLLKEEEASMINFYVNSLKPEKSKEVNQSNQPGKTMKQLIEDSMLEVEDSKIKHKTLLDWSALIVEKKKRSDLDKD